MAKDTTEVDDFDFDADLDFNFDDIEGGIQGSSDLSSKNRSPVMQAVKGAAQGVGEKFADLDTIKHLGFTALPKEYSATASSVGALAGGFSEIRTQIDKDIKPTAINMVKQVDKLIPDKHKRTKSMIGKAKDYLGISDYHYRQESTEERNNATITAELDKIFKQQMQVGQLEVARQDVKDATQEVRQAKRFKADFTLAKEQTQALNKLVGIAEGIQIPYMRKSLELQYRQHFMQQEMLAKSLEHYKVSKLQGDAISKNTALPDYVKLTNYERGAEVLRTKIAETLWGGMFSNNEMMKSAFGTGVKQVKDKISEISYGLQSGLGFIESINDMGENIKSAKEMGMEFNEREEMGKTAGSMAAAKFAESKARDIRERLSAEDSSVYAGGLKLKSGWDSMPGQMERLRDSEKLQEKEGDGLMMEYGKKLLKGVLDLPFQMSTSMDVSAFKNMKGTDPVPFDYAVRRSITDIIPGFLSRILREVQVFRTGDESTTLVTFNTESGSFSNQKLDKEKAKSAMTNRASKEYFDNSADSVLQAAIGDKELPPELKAKLLKSLKKSSFRLEQANGAVYDRKSLEGESFLESLSDEEKTLFLSAIEENIGEDKNHLKHAQLVSKITEMRKRVTDMRTEAQDQVRMGRGDALTELGIVKKSETGRYGLDINAFMSYMSGDSAEYGASITEEEPTPAPPGARRNPPTAAAKVDMKATNNILKRIQKDTDATAEHLRLQKALLQSMRDQMEECCLGKKKGKPGEESTDIPGDLKLDPSALAGIQEAIEHFKSPMEKTVELLQIIADKPVSGGMSLEQFAEFKSVFTGLGDKISSLDIGGKLETVFDKFTDKLDTLGINDKVTETLDRLNATMEGLTIGEAAQKAKGGAKKALGVVGRGALAVGIGGVATAGWAGRQGWKGTKALHGYMTGPVKDFAKSTASGIGGFAGNTLEWVNDRFLTQEERDAKVLKKQNGELPEDDKSVMGVIRKIRDQSFSLVGNTFSAVSSGIGDLFKNKLPKGWGAVLNVAGKVGGKVADIINRPVDVYIQGRGAEPVLRKVIMQHGGYICGINKTPIKTLADIKGPVYDHTGETELVSMEEFIAGLYDAKGRKLGGTIKNAVNLAGKLLGKPFGLAGRLLGKINPFKTPEFMKKGVGRVKDKWGRMTGDIDPTQVEGAVQMGALPAVGKKKGTAKDCCWEQVSLLTQIRDAIKSGGVGVAGVSQALGDGFNKVGDKLSAAADNAGEKLTAAKDKAKDFLADKEKQETLKEEIRNRVTGLKKAAAAKATELKNSQKDLTKGLTDKLPKLGISADSTEADINQQSLLTRILSVLQKGLVKPKKFNDEDGDGDRNGNGFDRLKSLKDKVLGKKKDSTTGIDGEPKEKSKGLFETISGGIGGLMAGIADTVGTMGEAISGLRDAKDMLGGDGSEDPGAEGEEAEEAEEDNCPKGKKGRKCRKKTSADRKRAKRGQGGKGGFWKKAAAKVGLGGAAKAASGAATAVSAASDVATAANAVSTGSKALTAGRAALTVGRVALTGAGLLMGGVDLAAGATLAASAASWIGGALGASVLLPVAAVVAAGVAGYYAYDYFTRNNSNTLIDMRLRQYGLSKNEESHYHKIFALEDYLKDIVQFQETKASLNSSKLDVLKVLEIFGVSEDDTPAVSNLVTWLDNRFKPVFLTHRFMLNKFSPKSSLMDVMDLRKEALEKYFNGVANADGPYSVMVSPFAEVDRLTVDAAQVRSAISAAREELKVKVDKPASGGEGASTSTEGLADKQKELMTTGAAAIPAIAALTPPAPISGTGVIGADGVPMPGQVPPIPGTPPAVDPATGMPVPPPGPFTGTAVPAVAGSLTGGDPSGGEASMQMADSSVHMEGLNTDFYDRLKAAAKKYQAKTGKRLLIKDGFRTYAEQVAMKAKYGSGAAEPGSSPHESGLAIDADKVQLDEMDALGILKEEGLTRPVGGERWHLEPAGIQKDILLAKRDKSKASEMIKFGIGRGGKGYGSIPGTPKPKRNHPMEMALLGDAPSSGEGATMTGGYSGSAQQPGNQAVGGAVAGATAVAAASTGGKGVDPNRYYDVTDADRADTSARKAAKEKGVPYVPPATTTATATSVAPTATSVPGGQQATTALESMSIEQQRKLNYYDPAIIAYAEKIEKKYGLPTGLLRGIIVAGERSNPGEASGVGAKGVMQFMPENLRKFNIPDPTNSVDLIDGAGRYFTRTAQQYKGNLRAMIADYNGGPKQAKLVMAGGLPAAEETRNYLERVTKYLTTGETPPLRKFKGASKAAAAITPVGAVVGAGVSIYQAVEHSKYAPAQLTPLPQQPRQSVQSATDIVPNYSQYANSNTGASLPVSGTNLAPIESSLSEAVTVLKDIRDILKGQPGKSSDSAAKETAKEAKTLKMSRDDKKVLDDFKQQVSQSHSQSGNKVFNSAFPGLARGMSSP